MISMMGVEGKYKTSIGTNDEISMRGQMVKENAVLKHSAQ